jgi:prepilin-type N-terminal cleavage/methylation domain-containing protein
MIKFKITQPSLKNKKAYTLIELSITILIISLLMAGVFSFATGSINNAKSALTNQRKDEIYESMGTYLMVNKRLPCPASILTSKVNDANYGQEVGAGTGCEGAGVYKSSTSGNLFFGGVPIRALNLSSEYAEDGYGNKFNYIIDRRFTYNFIATGSTLNDVGPSFGTADLALNVITIKERQTKDDPLSLVSITESPIFVLSSAGENGLRAFNAESGLQNNIDSTDLEEVNNQITEFNDLASPPTAVFDNIFIVKSLVSDNFDDIVFYKTRSDFKAEFSAERLIYCKGSDDMDGVVYTKRSLYYDQYLYAQAKCTNPISTNPPPPTYVIKTMRCNINGEWSHVLLTCP